MKRLTLAALAFVLSLDCAAESRWLPVQDVSLIVEPGSVLDFSGLVPVREAGRRVVVSPEGRWAFEDQPKQPQRFLMAALGFAAATGLLPDHARADLYARQLRMRGYNMARLDFADATLMHDRRADFDFDPEQRDRFFYLLAALKREGIYYVLDGLSSDNGGYGGIQERWLNRRNMRQRLYYDAEAQNHWKHLAEKVLGATNPYTGLTILQDPALAGVILVNEGGLAFVTRNGIPDALRPAFVAWLKKRYGTQKALEAAWKGELRPGETLDSASVGFPGPDQWTSRRMADAQRFFVDLERSTADWMTAHLRHLGYRGMVTAYDNWLSPAAHVSRSQFDWVDLHNYFFEPTQFTQPGSVMRQESLMQDHAKYIRELASGRHFGKSYSVSEYGQVFWNRYRRESALAVPAYASFQGWDMISQHAYAVELSYAARGGRKDAIYPFVVGLDPIARATETLAALLFLRADVAPAERRIGIRLGEDYVFNDSAFLGNIPGDLTRLGLVHGIGLDWQGRLVGTGRYDALVEPGNTALWLQGNAWRRIEPGTEGLAGKVEGWVRQHGGSLGKKLGKTAPVVDARWAGRVTTLRRSGLLPANNRTDPENGIYESDTGQITMDSGIRRLTVVTPRTEAVAFDAPGKVTLDRLTVDQADEGALVSVSAVDGEPLRSSRRMLVVLATDARNSAMLFTDAAETTLRDLGRMPVLIRAARVELTLRSPYADRLQVYSTTLRGKRGDAISARREPGRLHFVLDTSQLSHGPTTYFEIVAQDVAP